MIGQCYSLNNKKYNIIILAGGAGSRMGSQSDYIPKALTKLGNRRSIDYIIDRYTNVAHKFIIGTAYHSDLLISYIRGNYPHADIDFVVENPDDLQSNALSFAYCLDQVDSRYGTIVLFCDLIPLGNFSIIEDSILIATKDTKGKLGTFRHSYKDNKIILTENPQEVDTGIHGIMGNFVFKNTPLLKSITYTNYNSLEDLTSDIVIEYHQKQFLKENICEKVYEFGTEDDLQVVREIWEQC